MAVAGDLISASTITAATQRLTTLGTEFSRAATAVARAGSAAQHAPVPAAAFPFQVLERGAADAALREAGDAAVWANDLLCRQRATLGASLLQRSATGSMRAPVDGAFAAGVVVGCSAGISRWGWDFHAAIAYREEGSRGIRVVDHLLFDRPVPLSRWQQAIGARASDVTIESAFHAYPGTTEPPTALLQQTWDRIPDGYTLPGELRLTPGGTDTVMQRFAARSRAAA
jgi:hypothetical protein